MVYGIKGGGGGWGGGGGFSGGGGGEGGGGGGGWGGAYIPQWSCNRIAKTVCFVVGCVCGCVVLCKGLGLRH